MEGRKRPKTGKGHGSSGSQDQLQSLEGCPCLPQGCSASQFSLGLKLSLIPFRSQVGKDWRSWTKYRPCHLDTLSLSWRVWWWGQLYTPPNPLVFSCSSRMMVGVIPSSFPTWLISWMYSWKKHETCKESLTQGEAGLHAKDESIHGCTVGKELPQRPGAAPLMIKAREKGWPCTFSFLQMVVPVLQMASVRPHPTHTLS